MYVWTDLEAPYGEFLFLLKKFFEISAMCTKLFLVNREF